MDKSFKMLTLYTRGYKVKNVNIINKWVKVLKCHNYSQVGKRLEMSIFYINDQKIKIFNIMHKWLNMSTLYTSGLKAGSMKGQQVSTGFQNLVWSPKPEGGESYF